MRKSTKVNRPSSGALPAGCVRIFTTTLTRIYGVDTMHAAYSLNNVQKRLETNLKSRKSSRLTVFDSIRNLSRCESPAPPAPLSDIQQKIEHRRQQLEKWKEEKEKKKKEAAAQKKKPFLTGVSHAPLKFVPPPPPPKPSTSGRVTRSQSARNSKVKDTKDTKASQSFAPKNASFKPPELKNIPKLPKMANMGPAKTKKGKVTNITFEPVLPKATGRQTRARPQRQAIETKAHTQTQKTTKSKVTKPNMKTVKPVQSNSSSEVDSVISPILPTNTHKTAAQKSPNISQKTPRKSLQNSVKNVTPKNFVPKSESSSEERLRSPKSSEESMTPEHVMDEAKISPCVTMSRGKDNARREMKKKLEEGLLDDDASDMESVDHFRRQLASEIKRMTEMCEKWDRIFEQTALPETVQEAVLGAVGQARLLMAQKLQQFATLLERCARPEPAAALVTPADLHGFWDMVFMQVENVDMRFKKLEELQSRGWVEQQAVEVKKSVPKRIVKKPVKPTGGPSRLREMIAAARKAKKQQESGPESLPAPADSLPAPGDSKTFEAGFFCVRSPVRSSAAPSPAPTNTLLKAVLSSEAKKASASKNTASFAMLRASVLSKNVECDGITLMPQSPINLYATPGRSILKASCTKSTNPSGKKSIKVVLFDQPDGDNSMCLSPDKDSRDDEANADMHTDSGISSMDQDKVDDKENSRRKTKLVRQDAEDRSPVMTRSRRKSMNTSVEVLTPRRSKNVIMDTEDNVEVQTKRSTRRRKSAAQN